MKLGKVEHIRCSEHDATSYVLVPDDWTAEQFAVAVAQARASYQAAVTAQKVAPPNDYRQYSHPPYDDFPDSTVTEIKAQWREKKKEWEAWNTRKQEGQRSFSDHLADQGLVRLWSAKPDFFGRLDWGHQHGTKLDLDDEETDLRGVLYDPDGFGF